MVGLLAVLAASAVASPTPQRAATPAPSVAADTLRYATPAGVPFIVGLPARVDGAEATYRPMELPALSWLVDRSFFWNVQPGESGTLPVRFERLVAGRGAEPLVLLVEITPE